MSYYDLSSTGDKDAEMNRKFPFGNDLIQNTVRLKNKRTQERMKYNFHNIRVILPGGLFDSKLALAIYFHNKVLIIKY